MKFIKCLLVLGLFAVNVSAMDYSVSDFGARGDGKTVNTRAIQRVIDLCAEKGGKVIIPQGEFVTGTLFLKSNVTLRLERGAHFWALQIWRIIRKKLLVSVFGEIHGRISL